MNVNKYSHVIENNFLNINWWAFTFAHIVMGFYLQAANC